MITLNAESPITYKKYKIWVYVCTLHYKIEKSTNAIIDEVRTLGVKNK